MNRAFTSTTWMRDKVPSLQCATFSLATHKPKTIRLESPLWVEVGADSATQLTNTLSNSSSHHLRQWCRERGLRTVGRKRELIGRLLYSERRHELLRPAAAAAAESSSEEDREATRQIEAEYGGWDTASLNLRFAQLAPRRLQREEECDLDSLNQLLEQLTLRPKAVGADKVKYATAKATPGSICVRLEITACWPWNTDFAAVVDKLFQQVIICLTRKFTDVDMAVLGDLRKVLLSTESSGKQRGGKTDFHSFMAGPGGSYSEKLQEWTDRKRKSPSDSASPSPSPKKR